TLTYVRWANLTPVAALAVRARLARRGKRPYSIPPGATSMTGILGSAEVGLELAEQSHAGELEMPDAVFTALGSGGTAAGLALGLQLGGLAPEVVGVRVYPLPVSSQAWVRLLARRGHRRITRLAGNATHDFDASRITVRAGYLGAGYAAPTESGSAAEAVGKELGVPLDSTYTAKAFAAFLDAAKSPSYRDKNLVFLASHDPRLPSSM
ncbi:MAG: pyridoxal-phosphate dependent enzyme, partial [Acidimicrobiia bacterium]